MNVYPFEIRHCNISKCAETPSTNPSEHESLDFDSHAYLNSLDEKVESDGFASILQNEEDVSDDDDNDRVPLLLKEDTVYQNFDDSDIFYDDDDNADEQSSSGSFLASTIFVDSESQSYPNYKANVECTKILDENLKPSTLYYYRPVPGSHNIYNLCLRIDAYEKFIFLQKLDCRYPGQNVLDQDLLSICEASSNVVTVDPNAVCKTCTSVHRVLDGNIATFSFEPSDTGT